MVIKRMLLFFVAMLMLVSSFTMSIIQVKAIEKNELQIMVMEDAINSDENFTIKVKESGQSHEQATLTLPENIELAKQSKEMEKKVRYDEKERQVILENVDETTEIRLIGAKEGVYQLQLKIAGDEDIKSNIITITIKNRIDSAVLETEQTISNVEEAAKQATEESVTQTTSTTEQKANKKAAVKAQVPQNSDEEDDEYGETTMDEEENNDVPDGPVTRGNENTPPPSDLNVSDSFHIVSGKNSKPHPDNKSQVIITEDKKSQSGGMWYKKAIDLKKDFNLVMSVYLGSDPKGADGIAFVLQNDPRELEAIGEAGAGLGAYSGGKGTYIKNGLALELDTYYNDSKKNPGSDALVDKSAINKGHIAVQIPGTKNGLSADDHYGLQIAKDPAQILGNDKWRNLSVKWDSAGQVMTYSFEDYDDITYKIDDVAATFGGTSIYWGFTGSTGGSKNYQSVALVELPDQNIATIDKKVKNVTTASDYANEAQTKVGDTLKYKIEMKNSKENDYESLNGEILDVLDSRLEFKSGSLTINGETQTDAAWNNGDIILGNVQPGDEKIVEFEVTAKSVGLIKNIATYQADFETPRKSNETTVSTGDLLINKVDGDTKEPLQGVVYQVETADGTVVADNQETDAAGKVTVGYLEPGDYFAREMKALPGYAKDGTAHPFKIEADQTANGQAILNLENFKSPTPDPTISKTASVTEVSKGQEFEYTLTASNAENVGSWYHVILTDTLPDGLSYVSGDEGLIVDGQTVTWNIDELAAGATKSIKIKVRVTSVPTTETITNVLSAIGEDVTGAEFKVDDAKVSVAYKGTLELTSVPQDLNFGEKLNILPSSKTYPLVNYNKALIVTDTRITKGTWQLNARMSEQLNNDNSKLLDAIHFRTKDNQDLTLNDESTRIYQEKNTSDENKLSDNWSENKEGFSLLIDAGKGKPGDYKGVVEWTLSDAPAS